MKIIVFGARGDVGSRVVLEALSRGHQVTGVVRRTDQGSSLPPGVVATVVDVQDTVAVSKAMHGHDLAISAIRPREGAEASLPELTRSILEAAEAANIRVIIVGGAASLIVPGTNGHTVLTAPGFLPEDVVPIAQASQAQYELCQADNRADWIYVSPPAMLTPGVRTGQYRLGADELLVDEDGQSHISMEDLAVAMMDEGEGVHRHRARFTAAY